ncbi:hypothetical protein THAOC_08468, partial [Thalassiosira oceanica]
CRAGCAPSSPQAIESQIRWLRQRWHTQILDVGHGVTSVGFGKVVLSNEEWKAICNAIRTRNVEQTSIMDYFKLTECFGGGMSDEALKDILTSNAVEVGLESNGLSSREVPVIAQHLNSNSSLARLYLCGNLFNDKDAAALANALSSNTNLRVLSIEQNSIGKEGRLVFLRAIFDISSLASCAASNHTCQVVGLEQDISDLNCYVEVAYNKWDKIFAMLALSSDDSFMNTALLNGVQATLMPVLLHRSNDQFEECNSQITDLYLELTDTERCKQHDVWDNLGCTKATELHV